MEMLLDRKLTAIMATDVVGYTRLMGEDEAGTLAALKAHRAEFTDPVIAEHGGRIVKLMGDGVLMEFASVVDALQCAVVLQRGMAERNADVPAERRIEFRIGINLGDIIVDGDDIYGTGVNVAARLETLAEPGGICLSGRVVEQVQGNVDVGFASLGPQTVKNIDTPINAYKVLLDPADAGKITDIPKSKAKPWRWPVAVAIAALTIAIAVGAVWFYQSKPEMEPASAAKMAFPLPDKPSIAVLPFNNLSGDPEQEFLADGITEHIIATLAQIPQLFVIARNSTFTYKGKAVLVQQVAEEQGVRYVLEGSVQRSGDRIRVTAQLVDATQGHHLWSEHYDRDIGDLFALQDDIALKIATALQVQLTDGEQIRISSGTTRNLEAWSYWVKSFPHVYKYTKDSTAQARELQQRAVDIDPGFAAAWVYIAWTHFVDARLGYSESRERSLELAEEYLDRAAAIAPDLPSLPQLRGSIHLMRHEFEQAIAEGRKAMELSPSGSAIAASLALTMFYVGEYDEAIDLFRKAMRLSPSYPRWFLIYLSRAHAFKGDYDEAITVARDGTASDESAFMEAVHHVSIAFAYADSGDLDAARQEMKTALELAPFLNIPMYRNLSHHRDPADLERFIAALQEAGLPE